MSEGAICGEEIAKYCSYMNMTAVRALCPGYCWCTREDLSLAGFFQAEARGCPRACIASLRAQYNTGGCDDILQYYNKYFWTDIWSGYVNGLREYVFSFETIKPDIYNTLRWYPDDFNITEDDE